MDDQSIQSKLCTFFYSMRGSAQGKRVVSKQKGKEKISNGWRDESGLRHSGPSVPSNVLPETFAAQQCKTVSLRFLMLAPGMANRDPTHPMEPALDQMTQVTHFRSAIKRTTFWHGYAPWSKLEIQLKYRKS